MFYIQNDSVKTIGFADWEERIKKGHANGRYPRPKIQAVKIKITDWEIRANVALVSLDFYYGEEKAYRDFISLYKIDGTWKIVSKSFQKL